MAYKVVLVGSEIVGKSGITEVFLTGKYKYEYDYPFVHGNQKKINCDNEVCIVHIVDTTDCYIDQVYYSASGFMLVYSIASLKSFEEIQANYNKILELKEQDKCPMILIGNNPDPEHIREVFTADGQNLADTYGIPFLEASPFDERSINECFLALVREIRRFNHVSSPQEAKKKRNNTNNTNNNKSDKCKMS